MNEYPTREQAESGIDCNGDCPKCAMSTWCNDDIGLSTVILAMHDALDAKDAEIARLKQEHIFAEMAWRNQDGSQCLKINCIYRRLNSDNYDYNKQIKEQQAEIENLTASRDMWKSRAILLDGKYQNWIE